MVAIVQKKGGDPNYFECPACGKTVQSMIHISPGTKGNVIKDCTMPCGHCGTQIQYSWQQD
jgi:transcription elongation factor Elf1